MKNLKLDKKKENILIALALSALAIFVVYQVSGQKKIEIVNSYKKNTLSQGVIVSIPDTKFKKYKLVIVFGGMYYANPEWMFSQIPQSGLYNNILVIAPYTMSFETAKSIYEPYLKDYNVSETSIMGFSAGGLQVQNNYSENLKIAGLIDPSTKSKFLDLPFTSNTKMIYNNSNWAGSLKGIGDVQVQLEKVIKEKGGYAEKTNLQHDKIPKYFFEKFLNN